MFLPFVVMLTMSACILCDVVFLCQELESCMPQGQEKLEALENVLNAVMSHTNSNGQFALMSQLAALRDDFELLKTLLRDTSIHLGMLS